MFPSPFTGRNYGSRIYAPEENETVQPDLNLTLMVVIFCVAGPFWLLYRLVEFVTKKSIFFTSQALQKMRDFSRA